MQAKNKPQKVVRPKVKRVCCPLLRKLKPDIERYIQDLIQAQDDSSKMRWALGDYRADAMICTEPHNLNLTISHVGVNYFRVRVQGKISHAALAHLGVNAIGKMYLIYQALIDLDEKRGREVRFPLYEKGSGRSCHLSIGTMKGGDWPSNVAGSAEMECRIGYIPGEKMVDIKKLVERTVQEASEKDPWLKEHL